MLYWFLPFILFLGIITSYEDIKEGKIKNKWIILAIVYTIFIYFLIIITYQINNMPIRLNYFIELFVVALSSLGMGFVIWYAGLWTAGDAKLFFAYSLLVPLSVYKYGHVPYFSSINILINTFLPVFVFFIFLLLFKTNLKQKLFYLKKSFEPKRILQLSVFLFAFVWPINLLFSFLHIPPNYFFIIFVLFIFITIIEKLLKTKLFYIIIGFAILRTIFDKSIYTLSSWNIFFIILISFILLRFFVLSLGYFFFTKNMPIKNLKKGMVPAEIIIHSKGKYLKKPLLQFSLFTSLQDASKKKNLLFETTAEGLTEKDIKNIKSKKLPFEYLRIKQTISFAPFLFAGVLMTILVQGNLIFFIKSLF